jgi:hypothetical protein
MIEIHERYKVFQPPRWFRPTVERLLKSVSPEHTGLLQSVVLTDAASIGRGKTGRVQGRKHSRNQCLGFYHPARRDAAPWIELVADNILSRKKPMRLQMFRDAVVSGTLYHEIGHHLHATVGSATRGGEEAAEDWQHRLWTLHFRKRYWWLHPLFLVLGPLVILLRSKRFRPP